MVVAEIPLTLIPIATEAATKALCTHLNKLGCNVRTATPRHSLADGLIDQNGIAVFLVDRQKLSKEKIFSLFSDMAEIPRYGLFCNPQSEWELDLVECFGEISSWPCPIEELKIRLLRLRQSNAVVIRKNRDTESYSELVELNMVGQSEEFLSTVRRVRKFAQCDAPVLIEGETGTGKELMARAIHYLSARRDYPFIPVNCGAFPDSLLENELFGHEKGAYTDANSNYRGVIAQAEGGTLFLDEIESLSAKGQVILLRFLQELVYRPLGAHRSVKANIRIVTACNRQLDELVRQGEFRQDLQFRLNIMPVKLPPLRERNGDAELLAEHFLDTFRSQYSQPHKYLHSSSLRFITQHDWPGNVRELENMIHREFLLAEGASILFEGLSDNSSLTSEDMSESPDGNLLCHFSEAKKHAIEGFEKRYLRNLMREFQGNVTRAAQHAGKERRALGKLLKKHGINRYRYDQN